VIKERIDLVGNVSTQARKWARDISKLTQQARALNRAMGGGGTSKPRDRMANAEARAERQKAQAIKAQARATASMARDEAKVARITGRSNAKADAQAARQQAAAVKAQARAQAQAAREGSRASRAGGGGGRRGLGPALPRQEVGGIGGAVNSAAGNMAADVASMAAAAAMNMARTAIDATIFREQSIAGLTIMLKSSGKARELWQESFKLARDTGSTQREAMSSIQTMMASGFNTGDAKEMFKLMTAMSVVNPKANLEGISRAMAQIKMKGKLQAEELTGQLAEAGVNTELVYKALEKRLGKTRAQVLAMQQAGTIGSDDAIAAIKDAMKESVGGNVDKVLEGRAKSWGAIVTRLSSAPETFFAGLDKMDPSKAEQLKKGLIGVTDMLDPSTAKGAKFADSVGKLAGIIAGPGLDAFTAMVDKGGKMIDFLVKVTGSVESASAALGKLKAASGIDLLGSLGISGEGILETLLGPLYTIPKKLLEIMEQARAALGVSGSSIGGALVEAFMSAVLGPASGVVMQLIAIITGQTSGLPGIMQGIGQNTIQGLINGLMSGIPGLSAASSLISSITPDIVKQGHQQASPSKLFHKIGEYDVQGYASGIEDNMRVVQRSSEAFSSASTPTGKALPFVGNALAAAGAAGGNKSISMGGIRQSNTFHLGSERDGVAQEIGAIQRQMVQREIQAFFNKAGAAA
jgi:tape measure domain-containing protein